MKLFFSCLLVILFPYINAFAQTESYPLPMKIGASFSIQGVTKETMNLAKEAGISCIQINVNSWFDKEGNFKKSEDEINKEVNTVKKNTEEAGIKVWTIHMPYGRYIDISLAETDRQKVVSTHKSVLQFCRILNPEVILFHPSWYLSLNNREEHLNQLVKSVNELEKPVKDLGAIMVIENMTGPELHVMSQGVQFERPLGRTVEEMVMIMNKLPAEVYAAVDMNHIPHPEKMILALGNRLRFVHIADGDAVNELHYLPCSGKGINDWMAILDALYKVNYPGPFMFECHFKNIKDLKYCYEALYNDYVIKKFVQPRYKEGK